MLYFCKMNQRVFAILCLSLLFILPSCKFQKILKNGTVDEKYEAAVKLYESNDFTRALQLFDQLAGAMRATDKAQKIAYYYAFSYYNMRDYTMASYYFKRYSTNYPNTVEAEECLFMSAYCNVLSSPEFSLDQTTTYEALKDLQLFTNTYPKSKRVSECNDLMDQLRFKLELKEYKIARLFYRMEDYAAAIQCFTNILKEYPDSPHKEEILFLGVKSYYKYAKESVEGKQKDRHLKTVSAYNDFMAQYPESNFLDEAKNMKEKSKKELEALLHREEKNLNRIRLNN